MMLITAWCFGRLAEGTSATLKYHVGHRAVGVAFGAAGWRCRLTLSSARQALGLQMSLTGINSHVHPSVP
jgi:hypothetical protein